MSSVVASPEGQSIKFGCLVRVHKFHLVSLVLGTLYSPLMHALGYLNVPRLFFDHIGPQKPLLPLDIGKLSPMHIRK